MPEFLTDEMCGRCGGPILADPRYKTEFHEGTLDYTQQTVWICYACGQENTLQREPRYII